MVEVVDLWVGKIRGEGSEGESGVVCNYCKYYRNVKCRGGCRREVSG